MKHQVLVAKAAHSMKVEAIQYEPIMTREQMRQTIFEYIEVDYNRTRRHSALGYLSPMNCEKQNVALLSVQSDWSSSISYS